MLVSAVTVLPQLASRGANGAGPVEAAVTSELAGLAESRPSLVAIATRLAADLDNWIFTSSHAGLSRELMRVLDQVHRLPRAGQRLAAVTALAARRPTTERQRLKTGVALD